MSDAPPAVAGEHQPFLKGSFGLNTPPKKRASTSLVWNDVKRLKPCADEPRAQKLLLEGYTHICRVSLGPDDDGYPGHCNHPFKLTQSGGSWINTVAGRHLEKRHADTEHAKLAATRGKSRQSEKALQQLDYTSPASIGEMPVVGQQPMPKSFVLSKPQRELSSQVHSYVYSRMHVSKASFDDRYWRQSLIEAGASKLLGRQQLKKWVRAEFTIFLLYLKVVVTDKSVEAQGNAFAQFLHDGGTLASHQKYQAFAIQLIMAKWCCNLTVCFGLVAFADGHDAAVADCAERTFETRLGFKFGDVFGSVISDRAAKGVGDHLDVEEVEVCLMHDGDKLGASAIGTLTRSKNKKVINQFRKGEMILENARKMSSSFTTTHKYEAFWQYANETVGNVPTIVIKVDHNGTRVAAAHILLLSVIRLNRGLQVWHMFKARELQLQWTSTSVEWQAMAETEAVLNITRVTTTLAQYESKYTGAYAGLIKGTTINLLRAPRMAVVILDKVGTEAASKLPRTMADVRQFTDVGKEVRRRAQLEGERRFCGNTTDVVQMTSEIIMSDRELLATVLDVRTLGCTHIIETQRVQAKELFMTAYVEYASNANAFEKKKREEWEAKAQAQAEAAATEFSGKGKAPAAEEAKEKKPDISSGAKFGGSSWDDDDDEGEAGEAGELEGDEPPEIDLKEGFKIEARKVWKNWTNLLKAIDWREQFPDANLPEKPDLVFDLMDLDMGVFYRKLIKSDPDRKIYGHIPFMASCSYASIGALNAESFCERVLSAANLVVTDGNTLLSSEEVEMLSVLRINRRFMELCRSKFAKEAKQQFNQTIVEEDDEAAAAPSTSAGAGPSNSAAAAGTSNAAVQDI